MRSANTFFVYRIILESFNYFFSTVKDESKVDFEYFQLISSWRIGKERG